MLILFNNVKEVLEARMFLLYEASHIMKSLFEKELSKCKSIKSRR